MNHRGGIEVSQCSEGKGDVTVESAPSGGRYNTDQNEPPHFLQNWEASKAQLIRMHVCLSVIPVNSHPIAAVRVAARPEHRTHLGSEGQVSGYIT